MNYKDLETSEPGGRSFREPEAGIPYLPPWKMFFVILLNNSAKSFLVLQSGIMFGLVPLLPSQRTDISWEWPTCSFASGEVGYVKAAKTVLPHGVLEIPAIILTAAYGLWERGKCFKE